MLKTPCLNYEIRTAFIFCLYAGLRWCDVKTLRWSHVRGEDIALIPQKTLVEVTIPLHPLVKLIMREKKKWLVFNLPTADGANKILKQWTGVNAATVAGMLGHTSNKHAEITYQRYRVHVGRKASLKLPSSDTKLNCYRCAN